MSNISAAQIKYYNANTRNASVGDCVKRALCIAFGMDYDEVSTELNRIKRAGSHSAYNITPVYSKFMKLHGGHTFKVMQAIVSPYTGEEVPAKCTVDQFCDAFPTGTYILEVGEKNYSDHLCCCVDGVLYDSWDSRENKVFRYSCIKEGTTELPDGTADNIISRIQDYVIDYINALPSKMKMDQVIPCYFTMGSGFSRYNKYTYVVTIIIVFEQLPPESSKYHRSYKWGHELTIKANPTFDDEKNYKVLTGKIKQKLYDWVYNIRKDIKDAIESESFDWSEAKFVGRRYKYYSDEKKLIMNLPDWCRKLITNLYINDNPNRYGNGYKYEMYMDPLPEDPHPERGEVGFYADTLTELKDQLASYKKNGARYNYEY